MAREQTQQLETEQGAGECPYLWVISMVMDIRMSV